MLLSALAFIACLQLSLGFNDELIDRCCSTGRGWAIDNLGDQCGLLKNRYASQIEGQDRDICLNIAEICCIQTVESNVCKNGRDTAAQLDSCETIQVYRSDVRTWKKQKECCNCCQLGTLAASRLATCSAEEVMTAPVCQQSPLCCHSFQNCCMSRLSGSGILLTEENSYLTTAIPRTTFAPTTLQATLSPPRHKPDGMCFRYSAQLCEHWCHDDPIKPNGFSCSCQKGYQLRSNGRNCEQLAASESCEDSNPCHATAQCYDTSSGPLCRCPSNGYVLKDKRRCEDINECTDGTHTCTSAQNCINELGTFRCVASCPAGYSFDQASGTCTITAVQCPVGFRRNLISRQCEDIDECSDGTDSCSAGFRCENTAGSFTCIRSINCGTGYTMDAAGQRCIDEDECALGTHNCGRAFVCTNTLGSFRCTYKQCPSGTRLNLVTGACEVQGCPVGFEFDSAGNRCVDVDECATTSPCRRNERCINTPGSFTCELPRQSLQCQQGFEANADGTHCSDINECSRGTHSCRTGQRCINRIGGFTCECDQGYRMNRNTNECEDLDECARSSQQYCSAVTSTCVNTPGSYRCECKTGYRSNDGRNCEDVNECSTFGLCQHECVNTWGSFQCKCYPGYKLAANGRTCEDIDECSTVVPRGTLCYGVCENTPGSYRCTCPQGYQLAENGRECVDVDECATNTARCSGPNQVCVNTRGSYKCSKVECPRYFAVATDGTSRSQEYGVICYKKCPPFTENPECYSNSTSIISYHFIALPTMTSLPEPLVLFNFDTQATTFYPDVRFEIIEGNDRRLLDVQRIGLYKGAVRLLKPVAGPQDLEVKVRMEVRNLNRQVVSRQIAVVQIYVSQYDH